jgi:hypothetical protein
MAAIPEHIYKLRTFIKQHTDDSIYSDEFLYSLLKDSRNTLLERENKKFTKDSEFHKQTICMPLVISAYHDCDCLPFEVKCKVLKSKFELPKVLTGRNKELIRVLTVDGYNQIPFVLSTDLKNLKYTKTKAKGNKYGIINRYLTVFNNLQLKLVLIEGVFEDPLELSKISYCDEEGNETQCYDLNTTDFPIKGSLDFPMYQICLDMLKIPLQIKSDDTNNANPEQ